jgi:Ca2+-binding EF-hand superfamily protein
MNRRACILAFGVLIAVIGSAHAQRLDDAAAPRSKPEPGRFAVATAGDMIVLVDTATGRSWFLKRLGDVPTWVALGSPAESQPRAGAKPRLPGAGKEIPDERARSYAENILRLYDRNGDGKLDQQELEATRTLRHSWKQYDLNKDGGLDLDELTAFVKAEGNANVIGGIDSGGQSPEERTKASFDRFDTNKDGKLSREEFPRFIPAERFNEWDTNKDGFIDLAEFTKGMQSLMPGGGRRN